MAAGEIIGEEEYRRWIHPPHALALLHGVADSETLISTISDHLEDGLIRAAAETLKITAGSQQWSFVELDPRFWLGWACLADKVFWQTGNRETFRDGVATTRFGLAPVRIYRVRFDPNGIDKLLPPPLPSRHAVLEDSAQTIPPPSSDTHFSAITGEPKTYSDVIRDADMATLRARGVQMGDAPRTVPNPGGRPRKDYWEPMLTAVAAQLYNGDLKPRVQADLERAMQQWLAAKGHSASDAAVRDRARSLWAMIKDSN